jgi:hypothetical protein
MFTFSDSADHEACAEDDRQKKEDRDQHHDGIP